MKVALVCIAKNEENYIQEWIDYNKKIGFDDIFIFQNDWRWPVEQDNVRKFECDGVNMQRSVYNSFLATFKNDYDWVAFFDVDEFLVLKKHSNVKDFITEYKDAPAIAINWVLFGNNGHEKVQDDYSVVKRFTMRQIGCNMHIKCIINTLATDLIMDVHSPVNYGWLDTNKNIGTGALNQTGNDDIAQINHYFCKTPQEFQEKCDRGRADTTHKRTFEVDYNPHNINEIQDLNAYNLCT
jgi:hypothetical protein